MGVPKLITLYPIYVICRYISYNAAPKHQRIAENGEGMTLIFHATQK